MAVLDEVDLFCTRSSRSSAPIGDKFDLDFPLRWNFAIHILGAFFFANAGKIGVGFEESDLAGDPRRAGGQNRRGFARRATQRNPHGALERGVYRRPEAILAEGVPLDADHRAAWRSTRPSRSWSKAEQRQPGWPPTERRRAVDPGTADALAGTRWLVSLPHCLMKINRVSWHLGLDIDRAQSDPYVPRSRTVLAVPFVGKDVPSRSSEFAHPDVVLGLSVLAYRYRACGTTDTIMATSATFEKEVGPYRRRRVPYQRVVDREAGGASRAVAASNNLTDKLKSSSGGAWPHARRQGRPTTTATSEKEEKRDADDDDDGGDGTMQRHAAAAAAYENDLHIRRSGC